MGNKKTVAKWTGWRCLLPLIVAGALFGGTAEAATAATVPPAPKAAGGAKVQPLSSAAQIPEPSYPLLLARKLDVSLWHDLENTNAQVRRINGETYLPLSVLAKWYPLKWQPVVEKKVSLLELQWSGKVQKYPIASATVLSNGNTRPPLLSGVAGSAEMWISASSWSQLTGMEVLPEEGGSVILNSAGVTLQNSPELDKDWQLTERPRVYGYRELTGDLEALKKRYPDMILEVMGKSSTGSDIPLIKIGSGPKEVFISGAWHGEEWVTAQLLTNFSERVLQRRQESEYQDLLRKLTLYIVPMMNPDGCEIAAHWDDLPANTLRPVLNVLLPQGYHPREWRANAQGYDLNNQFPVNWDRTYELTKNRGPAVGVAGPAPLVAPESKQVYDFTLKRRFVAVFCYHSQGEVIYWQDDNTRSTPEMRRIADTYAGQSGYWRVDDEPLQGGYRDWFVNRYHRPGLTVEVGRGENPLPVQQFPAINERNQRALLKCLTVLADE